MSPRDNRAKRWLEGHGFYFAERWLNVAVLTRTLPEDGGKKRFEIQCGAQGHDILRRIFTEAFTVDRRFHLKQVYDQELANRIIESYILDAIERNMLLLVCRYKGKSIGALFLEEREDGFFVYLAGVIPRYQGTGAAVELYRAAAGYCLEHGGGRMTGRVSSANTAVMNLYGMLKASYSAPSDLYIYDKGEIRHADGRAVQHSPLLT